MPFGVWTRIGPRNRVFRNHALTDGGAGFPLGEGAILGCISLPIVEYKDIRGAADIFNLIH